MHAKAAGADEHADGSRPDVRSVTVDPISDPTPGLRGVYLPSDTSVDHTDFRDLQPRINAKASCHRRPHESRHNGQALLCRRAGIERICRETSSRMSHFVDVIAPGLAGMSTVERKPGGVCQSVWTGAADGQRVGPMQVEPSSGVQGHRGTRCVVDRRADRHSSAVRIDDLVGVRILSRRRVERLIEGQDQGCRVNVDADPLHAEHGRAVGDLNATDLAAHSVGEPDVSVGPSRDAKEKQTVNKRKPAGQG